MEFEELFTAVVDADATEQTEGACPEAARLLLAAGTLGVHPARAAVVDATAAGVLAARAAGFGLVIGLDRDGGVTTELGRHGADLVFTSLRAVGIDEDAAQHRWWQTRQTTEASVGHAGWLLDYAGVDPYGEGIREALCTVGNGYLAARGAAPEVDAGPVHYPGTYAAGVFNRLRTRVHGHLHDDESLVNLPNWLVLRWGTDQGRWVDPDEAGVSEYRQTLDLRAGVLHRRYRYVDGDGRATTVVSTILVSMAAPHLAAVHATFVPENWSGTLHVCSAIDGQVANRQVAEYAPLAGRHLHPEGQGHDDPVGLWLRVRTSQSGIDVAVAARTRVLVPDAHETPTELFNTRNNQWMPDHSALQRHIGLAIAYSVWQYYQATGDLDFLRSYGAELMMEIARFFADLAQENPATGRYEITGVMGPDEFHDAYPDTDTPGLANNAYTNVMTVWLPAAAAGDGQPPHAAHLPRPPAASHRHPA
ncbi:hypothetical protein [Micromonospora sp. NPDC000442]|uniref:hypothetical protein n=1 Tax=Micromonospora sp. NPDC000442 TaxID=3364217 RepID=UPI00369BDEC6